MSAIRTLQKIVLIMQACIASLTNPDEESNHRLMPTCVGVRRYFRFTKTVVIEGKSYKIDISGDDES